VDPHRELLTGAQRVVLEHHVPVAVQLLRRLRLDRVHGEAVEEALVERELGLGQVLVGRHLKLPLVEQSAA